jgi:hypothetical protein
MAASGRWRGETKARSAIEKEREQMARNSLIAFAQAKLDETRRQARDAVVDFSIPDETVLELRKEARRAYEELKEFDRRVAKKGLFSFLGL